MNRTLSPIHVTFRREGEHDTNISNLNKTVVSPLISFLSSYISKPCVGGWPLDLASDLDPVRPAEFQQKII